MIPFAKHDGDANALSHPETNSTRRLWVIDSKRLDLFTAHRESAGIRRRFL